MKALYNLDEIREKLRPIFEAAPIYKAILFGSYAKGAAMAKSDIDIVIDSRGEIRGIDFFGVLEDIVVTLNMDVDLIEASEIRQDSPLLDEIDKSGVTIYER